MTAAGTPDVPQAKLVSELGGRGGGPLVLSLCVPTYNRGHRLKKALDQITTALSSSPYGLAIELVVSNNASTDETASVVRDAFEQLPPGTQARSYIQSENIGGERNFKFLYEVARGDYVCLWGDDDDLNIPELDRLIADLYNHRPEVCLTSFSNFGNRGDTLELGDGAKSELVTDLKKIVEQMYPTGKICQYVIRRHDLTPEDLSFSARAAQETSFWFIALALWLLRTRERRLLVRTGIIGWSGKDSWDMRFSPRVYATKRDAVIMALSDDPLADYFTRTLKPEQVDNLVVGNLFRTCIGLAKMDKDVAVQEFRYVQGKVPAIFFSGWRNAVKLPFVLALFPLALRVRY